MSRRSARNRHRPAAAKARALPAGTVTLTTEQLGGIITGVIGGRADPMPEPPTWSLAPFGPGNRLVPAPINQVRPDTGRAEPRLYEYPVSWNIRISNEHHVPWRILGQAADIPLLRKCIQRRKTVCDLDFTVGLNPKAVAREASATGQSKTDIEAAMLKQFTPEITRISDWLEVPDRKNGLDWAKWTSLLMENRLVYDATVVYPRRTYGGDLFALEVIDGSTIKPLLDEYGGRPMPPYPAYQQLLYGWPRGEFTAEGDPGADGRVPGLTSDELLYERTVLRPKTPYGMSATEIALQDAIIWMRRMGWVLAEYTEGVMPDTYLETSDALDWSTTQWEDWLIALNEQLGGNTASRLKVKLFPPGTKAVQAASIPERYKPEYDRFLVQLIAGDYGLPASEVGFTETGALGASFHEGEEDILNRQTRRPDANWLAGIATRLMIRQLEMPPQLCVQILGLESEDEAAADAVASARVNEGRMTRNEDRARMGLPPLPDKEAGMAMITTSREVIPLGGALDRASAALTAAQGLGEQQDGGGDDSGPGKRGMGRNPGPGAARAGDGGQDGGPGTSAKSLAVAAGRLGHAAYEAAALAREADPASSPDGAGPAAGSAAELVAYRRWAKKGGQRGQFVCNVLTGADAPPEMAADPRVVFKAGEPGPKASAGRGLAGTGTRS